MLKKTILPGLAAKLTIFYTEVGRQRISFLSIGPKIIPLWQELVYAQRGYEREPIICIFLKISWFYTEGKWMSDAYVVCSVNILSKPQLIQGFFCCPTPTFFLPMGMTSIWLKIPVSLVSILEFQSLWYETCIRQMRVNPGAPLPWGAQALEDGPQEF